jgi:hypothetical protein
LLFCKNRRGQIRRSPPRGGFNPMGQIHSDGSKWPILCQNISPSVVVLWRSLETIFGHEQPL